MGQSYYLGTGGMSGVDNNAGLTLALLYTWYREGRFDETHLKWVVETVRMEVLLANLLHNMTT